MRYLGNRICRRKLSWSKFAAFVTKKLGESDVATGLIDKIEELIGSRKEYAATCVSLGMAIPPTYENEWKEPLVKATVTYLTGSLVNIIGDNKLGKMEKRNLVNTELEVLRKLGLTEEVLPKPFSDQLKKVRAC